MLVNQTAQMAKFVGKTTANNTAIRKFVIDKIDPPLSCDHAADLKDELLPNF